MKVLVACEMSGVVREAFRRKGHEAWSCDIEPAEDGSYFHYQCDVLDVLDNGWDLMIAHPPCTYLSVSGARWLYNVDGSRNEDRWEKRDSALKFVKALMDADIEKICIENPVSMISSQIRKPDQTVQPWQFGDAASKRTCFWLKNLSLLESTNTVTPETHTTASGRVFDKWWWESSLIQDLNERAKFRSKTFQGIADAMADQWG